MSKMHPSHGRSLNIKSSGQPNHVIVVTDDDIKRKWCRWCFRTHFASEHAECKELAHEVHKAEPHWTPDYVTAWRGFKIVELSEGDPMLRGMRAGWPSADPGPAECIGNSANSGLGYEHKSPHPLCTCGFHALKDRSEISSQMAVHAKVQMWGDVIEHEDGYRSERIKIVGLDYTNHGLFLFQRRERIHHTMHKLRTKYEVGEIK